MSRATKYDAELDTIEDLLRAKPMSAREVADVTGTSIQTAWKRIQDVRARGADLVETATRVSLRGPPSVRYRVRQTPVAAPELPTPHPTIEDE